MNKINLKWQQKTNAFQIKNIGIFFLKQCPKKRSPQKSNKIILKISAPKTNLYRFLLSQISIMRTFTTKA